MGQYYSPIFLKEDNKPFAYFESWDFKNGSKLMEHSYIRNAFVNFVEMQLINNPTNIVWAGDYADNEENLEYNLYDLKDNTIGIKITHNEGEDLSYKHKFKNYLPKRYKYILNHDKKEFVNKATVPSNDGWEIHPLPLLTCEGNGRGGGDYRGENDYIGIWSRNKISVISRKSDIPKDFKEIKPNFTE